MAARAQRFGDAFIAAFGEPPMSRREFERPVFRQVIDGGFCGAVDAAAADHADASRYGRDVDDSCAVVQQGQRALRHPERSAQVGVE